MIFSCLEPPMADNSKALKPPVPRTFQQRISHHAFSPPSI
jgi:hypothetical protein